MKKIFAVLLIIVSLMSVSYANYISQRASIFNIEIQNIDDDIKSIWLCIYDENGVKIEDVFKEDSNLVFHESDVSGRLYSKDNNAYIERSPRPSGDGYENVDLRLVVKENADYNLSYNKKEYIVDINAFDDETYYTPKKLIELYEIHNSKIDNNKLSISILDTSVLDEHLKQNINAGFAVRFENENEDYKTVIIGNNIVEQGRAKDYKPESSRIIKNVEVDYIGGKISTSSNIDTLVDEIVNAVDTGNKFKLLFFVFVILLVSTLL